MFGHLVTVQQSQGSGHNDLGDVTTISMETVFHRVPAGVRISQIFAFLYYSYAGFASGNQQSHRTVGLLHHGNKTTDMLGKNGT